MKTISIISLHVFLLIFPGCESEEKPRLNRNLPPQQNFTQPRSPQLIQKQENIDPKDVEEILAVVKENLEATIAEDEERVLATIHKDSPQYSSTVKGMEFVFANFDLEFNMEKAEVVEVSENDAKVYYIQTVRAVRGQGFTNKRDEGIHHLKKFKGDWKIFKTENISSTPLR